MDGKKAWKKTGFGILFVAACFVAMYILMEFHGKVLPVLLAAVLLLVTAFFFLNEIFSEKAKNWALQEEEPSEVKEIVSSGSDGEFRLKIAKHMKEMENTQKELIEVLKNQSVLLQNQMENVEQAIIVLSEKQANQTKSVIKFNKENARQLAISERETLEYVMTELKAAIENNAGTVIERAASEMTAMPEIEPVAAPVAELEEVSEEELFEVADLPGDDEYVVPEMPVLNEEPLTEEIPAIEEPVTEEPEAEELDLSALFEDMAAGTLEEAAAEEPVIEFPAIEDIPIPEEIVPMEEQAETPIEEPTDTAPAADPLAGLSGDPNAMMTPEDIAKLLASMGQ